MAGNTWLSVSYVVSTSTRDGTPRFANSLMAVTPSVLGIRRSMRITSGRRRSPAETASAPSAASPTTSKRGSAPNMPRSPSRTTGWSSTISSEINFRSRQGSRAPSP
ncbi:hypothetical protein QF026_000176 [Streptomyces aurantiacus]|nr:hypothetical protein [Streptomyces aurantiacus]